MLDPSTLDAGSSDASGRPLSLSVAPSSFNCTALAASPIMVTLTVTSSGSSATCTSAVTVVAPPPVAICRNVAVFLNGSGLANIAPGDLDEGSHGACAPPDLSATATSFSCASLGANAVTLTALASGVTETCTAVVTVMDGTNPEITCPANVTLPSSAASLVTATLDAPTATDNCPSLTVSNDAPAAGFPLGDTVVTWTATDPTGNTATCQQTVTRDCCMSDLGPADMGPGDLGPSDLGPADLGPSDVGPADLGNVVSDMGASDLGAAGSDSGASVLDASASPDQAQDGGDVDQAAPTPDQGGAVDAGPPPPSPGSSCAAGPRAPAGPLGALLLVGVAVARRRR